MDSDATGASSAPQNDTPGSDVLANLTADQRAHWRETGEISDASTPPAASAPAAPAAQAPSTEGTKPAAASEPAKPHKNAETRKVELDADIQSRLQRRKDIDAEITAAESRLTQLRTAPPSETKPAAPPAAAAPVVDPKDPEPNPDTFPDGQFDKGYMKAQARWETRQEFRQQMAEGAHRAQAARAAAVHQYRLGQFKQRTDAAAAADPAFFDSLTPEVKALKPYSALTPEERGQASALNALADELLELEHPEGGLRYFSAHPDELQRFAGMDVRTFLIEWGKLQPTLEAGQKPASPPAQQITRAPAPPTTVGRRATEPSDEAEAAVARGDFRAFREAQNRKEIGAR